MRFQMVHQTDVQVSYIYTTDKNTCHTSKISSTEIFCEDVKMLFLSYIASD